MPNRVSRGLLITAFTLLLGAPAIAETSGPASLKPELFGPEYVKPELYGPPCDLPERFGPPYHAPDELSEDPKGPVADFITSHYGAKTARRFAPLLVEKAKKYKLDPLLVARLIRLESDFNPRELSGKDAMGLMQVRRGHARHGEDLYDPATNLDYGCRILREYTDEFGGDMHRGLTAYLHGPIYVASRGVMRSRYSRKLLGE